jgi:dTDP-4-amino-4,6-dideoxygalactose transaminase
MTCSATNMAIMATGAEIVWADVDPRTGEIDPDDAERMVSCSTRALMCADWGGYPCDLNALNEVADMHGIRLVEDAAQALGAKCSGVRVGSHADYTVFSFQAIKIVTSGDGGALTCRSALDRERARSMRWFGIDRDNPKRGEFGFVDDISEWGYKAHMNDVAAAIGLANLEEVDGRLTAARANAAYFRSSLDMEWPHVHPVKHAGARESSCWFFPVMVDNPQHFADYMLRHRIVVSRVHNRNDHLRCFRRFMRRRLPGVDEFSKRQVAVPCGPWLTVEDRERIAEAMFRYGGSLD